jgi:Sigma-70 region 2
MSGSTCLVRRHVPQGARGWAHRQSGWSRSTSTGRNEDAEGLVLRARPRADRHRFPLGDLATFHRHDVCEMTTRARTDTDRLLSDADLVSASRAGNRGAFDELLRRHRREVNGDCRRVLGSPGAAADAPQGATLLAYLHLERLENLASFEPWVTGIALNACRRSNRSSANFDDQTDAGPLLTVDRDVDEGRDADEIESAGRHIAP